MPFGRSWDAWIADYAKSHQHPVNRLTHTVGIPMIAVEGKPPEFFKDWRYLFVGLRWWAAKVQGKA